MFFALFTLLMLGAFADDCESKRGKVCAADPDCEWTHRTQTCTDAITECSLKMGKECKDDTTCEWLSSAKLCVDVAPCVLDGCCQRGKAKGLPIDQDEPNNLLHKPQANEYDCAATCTDPECKWWTFDTTTGTCTLLRDTRKKTAGTPLGVSFKTTRFVSGPKSCKPEESFFFEPSSNTGL